MELQPCGTWGAYLRHRKSGERPCEPCREASRAKSRRQYAEKGRSAPIRPTTPVEHRVCGQCEQPFEVRKANQRYCTVECRTRFRNRHPRGSRARTDRALQRDGFLRPIEDGAPVIGPQRVIQVRYQELPLGGLWVFCPWCAELTVRRASDDQAWRCAPCQLDIELREVAEWTS